MKRLYRNKIDYKLAGICSGIADYFDIDLVISRLIFLLSFLVGGLILYLINWIIILVKDTSN